MVKTQTIFGNQKIKYLESIIIKNHKYIKLSNDKNINKYLQKYKKYKQKLKKL